jgi:hypothetical protein
MLLAVRNDNWVGPETLQILESRAGELSRSDLAMVLGEPAAPAIVAPSVRAELRLVMEQVILNLTERRLRMLDFLGDLKR